MTKELTGAQQEISEKIHTENVKMLPQYTGLNAGICGEDGKK